MDKKKTIYEWAEEFESELLSTDGFRRDIDWNLSLVNKNEFIEGAKRCSMKISPKLIWAFEDYNLKFNINK